MNANSYVLNLMPDKKDTFSNCFVDRKGNLRLFYNHHFWYDSDYSMIWDIVKEKTTANHEYIWLAGKDSENFRGKISQIINQKEVFSYFVEEDIVASLIDNNQYLYYSTAPQGKVYRMNKHTKKNILIYESKKKKSNQWIGDIDRPIWSICQDQQYLYVAISEPSEILFYAKDKKNNSFSTSNLIALSETDVISKIINSEKQIYFLAKKENLYLLGELDKRKKTTKIIYEGEKQIVDIQCIENKLYFILQKENAFENNEGVEEISEEEYAITKEIFFYDSEKSKYKKLFYFQDENFLTGFYLHQLANSQSKSNSKKSELRNEFIFTTKSGSIIFTLNNTLELYSLSEHFNIPLSRLYACDRNLYYNLIGDTKVYKLDLTQVAGAHYRSEPIPLGEPLSLGKLTYQISSQYKSAVNVSTYSSDFLQKTTSKKAKQSLYNFLPIKKAASKDKVFEAGMTKAGGLMSSPPNSYIMLDFEIKPPEDLARSKKKPLYPLDTIISDIKLYYTAVNQAPYLTDFDYKHEKQNQLQFFWSVVDDNESYLYYSLFYRQKNNKKDDVWRILAKDVSNKEYTLKLGDSDILTNNSLVSNLFIQNKLTEGFYDFKLVCEDTFRDKRTPSRFKNTQVLKNITIDTSPPIFQNIKVAKVEKKLLIQFEVIDEWSIVKKCEYSFDQNKKYIALPKDLVFDEKSEFFSFSIDNSLVGKKAKLFLFAEDEYSNKKKYLISLD